MSGRPAGEPAPGGYRLREAYYFLPVAAGALALGMWGFLAAAPATGCHAGSFQGALFRSLLLLARSGGACNAGVPLPPQLVIAQVLLPLLLALGTIFAGVKLALRNLRHDARLALVRSLRGHTVVCGLGETGLEAVRQLARQPGKVVAVCLDATEAGARACERLGVAVIAGDAAVPATLAAAGIAHARAAIISTGSDGRNMEICLAIQRATLAARGGRGHGLKLFPELRGAWLLESLGAGHAPLLAPGLDLYPFQASQIIARLLLRDPRFAAAAPAPRLLFAGFGELAEAILRHAVLSTYALPGVSVRAAALDQAPPPPPPPGIASWRNLVTLTNATHRFGASEPADEAALRAELAATVPHIAIITLPDDDLALQTAVLLRRVLDSLARPEIPIFVRVRAQGRLADMLGQIAQIPDHPDRLRGFGDLSAVVSPEALFDEQLDMLARAVHQTYLDTATTPSPARAPWESLAERYRRSSRMAADHIEPKLNFAGYCSLPGAGPGDALDAAAIEAMAQAEHDRWRLTLTATGWRYGETRSELARTHPLLRAWNDLPETVRQNNRAVVAEIPRMLARVGRVVRRK